jgi:hypothetical protein
VAWTSVPPTAGAGRSGAAPATTRARGKAGRLCLIDLAGNERGADTLDASISRGTQLGDGRRCRAARPPHDACARSRASSQSRLRPSPPGCLSPASRVDDSMCEVAEGAQINQSLLALKECIRAVQARPTNRPGGADAPRSRRIASVGVCVLSASSAVSRSFCRLVRWSRAFVRLRVQTRAPHVPFRTSKLTMLLKHAFIDPSARLRTDRCMGGCIDGWRASKGGLQRHEV